MASYGSNMRCRVGVLLALSGWAGTLWAQQVAGGAVVASSGPVVKRSTKWVIPPIKVRGRLTEILRVDDGSDLKRKAGATTILTMDASSYIWRPWFTQVIGSVSANYNRTVTKESPSATGTFLTGNITFNVFPISRFPASIYAGVSDNRTESGFVSAQGGSKYLGYDQSYAPLSGRERYRGGFRRTISESEGKKSTATNMNGNASFLLSRTQTADLIVGLDQTSEASFVRTQDKKLVASHQFSEPDELMLNVRSTGTLLSNKAEAGAAAPTTYNDFMQLNSYGNWLPDTEKPLRLNGNVLAAKAQTQTGPKKSASLTLAASAAGNYEPDERTIVNGGFSSTRTQTINGNTYVSNQNLSANRTLRSDLAATGSIVMTETTTPGRQTITSTQTAGLSYSPLSKMIRQFRHSWGAGFSVSNQASNQLPPKQTAMLRGRQNLLRQIQLSETSSMGLTLSQSANVATRNRSVGHSASVSWRRSKAAFTSDVTASVSDTRNYGQALSGAQILNVQGNANGLLSRTSTLTGSMTYQAGRRLFSPIDTGIDVYASGSLTYTQSRFMNVPRLFLSSVLNVMWSRPGVVDINKPPGEPVGSKSLIWENDLRYVVGLLETDMKIRIAKVDNRFTQTWILSLSRRF
ncbi:MAG: hypothetical protein AB1513_02565 [Pseudomonadota bacterium]